MSDLLETIKYLIGSGYPWPALLGVIPVGFVLYRLWVYAGLRNSRLFLNRYFVLAVVVSSLVVFLYLHYWGLPEKFAADDMGILISLVPGDKNRVQQQTYAQAIRKLVSESPDLAQKVKVRLLGRPLPDDEDAQQEEALKLGRRLRATFVLRVVPVAGADETWITIVEQPDFSGEEGHVARISSLDLVNIDRLRFPSDVANLARCTLALSFFHRKEYPQAIVLLREVLKAAELLTIAPSRPFLNSLLGNSYVESRFLNPRDSLLAAIAAYNEALKDWNSERKIDQWLVVFVDRAVAYTFLPGADRQENLSVAVRDFQTALSTLPEDQRIYRGGILINLSEAYRNLVGTDRATQLRNSIAASEAALRVLSRAGDLELWAAAMHNRGAAYADLGDLEKEDSDFRQAIESADNVLTAITPEKFPYSWASTINSKGVALRGLDGPDVSVHVDEALQCFKQALKVWTRSEYPLEWAAATNNEGTAYAQLGGKDNFEKAAELLKSALEVRTATYYPGEWADSLLTLNQIYLNQADAGEESKYWQVIAQSDEIVKIFPKPIEQLRWTKAVAERAYAYAQIKGPSRIVNLPLAIRSYDEILQQDVPGIRKSQKSEWLFNRGNCLFELAVSQKNRTLLGGAQSSYELVAQNEGSPSNMWASAMFKRGLVLLSYPSVSDEQLKEAIDSFNAALVWYTREQAGATWAELNYQKGLAYLRMRRADEETLNAAIECLNNALQILTQGQSPAEWQEAVSLLDKAHTRIERFHRKRTS